MNTGHPITNTKIDPSSIPEPKHLEKNTLANYPWAKESGINEDMMQYYLLNLERIRLFR